MKKCARCKTEKPESDFNRKGDGYQAYCRECCKIVQRQYYDDNKADFINKAKARKKRIRDKIKTICETNPCSDCKLYYHYCQMDFDHIRGEKIFEIGRATRLGVSWNKIEDEMKKCELVCSNCHRLRTWKRIMGHSSNG